MTAFDVHKLVSSRTAVFSYAILLFSGFCAYKISIHSPITAYAGMDPRGSSLVAQSLIERGTIRVDGFKLPAAQWLFEVRNGHTYSTYPLGTPLLLLPFVAFALSGGGDMQVDKVDFRLQKEVGGLTLLAFMCLAFLILRSFASPLTSALLAGGWTLGSGVMSTMGAALWSVNFTVIFESVVILILVRYFTGESNRLRPLLVGSLLFAAYLCRPSAALLAVPTAVLIWRRSKLSAVKLVATFFLLLLPLSVFSFREFGTWLPEYYSSYGATGAGISFVHFRNALYGLTFGPARGLFVYQPFLLLVPLAAILTIRKLWRKELFWLGVSWIILDLALVARWPVWWGGGSFGSRLLVESFPGWVMLTGMAWAEMSALQERIVPFALSFGMLVGLGIFINSYQGLYNWSTWEWNALPYSLGSDPKNNYDWRYPQFLASPEMIKKAKTKQRPLAPP
jgi:hypothetical protein